VTLTDLAPVPLGVWFALAAVVGLIFGSFVTALSYRLPRGENFVNARSKCPACGTVLQPRDLVPVLSWALSVGRCRVCRAPVSIRYPLTELLMAALFVMAVAHETRLVDLGLLLLIAVLGLTLSIIDLETRRLPLPLLGLLFGCAALSRWQTGEDLALGLAIGTGVAVLGVALAAVTRAWRGSPVLGAGDAYTLAIAAVALPLPAYGFFLGIAGLMALGLGGWWRLRFNQPLFPFAPAAFGALWVCLLYADVMFRLLPT
jgi:leader peptidase (prepilin peptidase) / N-methyltransferase